MGAKSCCSGVVICTTLVALLLLLHCGFFGLPCDLHGGGGCFTNASLSDIACLLIGYSLLAIRSVTQPQPQALQRRRLRLQQFAGLAPASAPLSRPPSRWC
eukprot:GHVU01036184.1.p3 GENE.GHVU01036184.1~~GHVU01036184.1.p3  ORF type:complete len:101 (-),score=8.42 GHVU01036184.1:508-810(-)